MNTVNYAEPMECLNAEPERPIIESIVDAKNVAAEIDSALMKFGGFIFGPVPADDRNEMKTSCLEDEEK